jgi:arylsulfatase A-like enzyme
VQTNGWLDQSFGFQQGFDRYIFPRGSGGPWLERSSLWAHADRVYAEAVHLVDAHDPARPFFLYLHFMDVHEYAAPPEFKTFGTGNAGAYRSAIRWVDDAVQRVREKLAEAGLLDRTVLVFAADHGETFGEHGVHGHARNVLTPVISVPLVIRFPDPVDPIRISTQVRNLDLAPTLLEMLDIPPPPSFEGSSLLPLIAGTESESGRVSFAELGTPLFPDASIQVSVTDGAWTYARNAPAEEVMAGGRRTAPHKRRPVAPGAELLFDRGVDPDENVNLIDLEPAEAVRMRALLDAHLAREAQDVLDTNVHIDPGIADRLRAMGYLE